MTLTDFMKNPQLEGDDFFWKGNSTGFLLIHGFTATTAEIRLIAEKLHADGYTTSGVLLPGHGTRPEELNHTPWQMWLEKVKRSYEALLRECDRVFIVAESIGALLAIDLAAEHQEIAGLLLFAPAIKARKLWLSRLMVPFKENFEKTGKDDGLPWKGYTVYPVKAAVEMLKLQEFTRKQLKRVTQPTLIFTGEYDRTITADAAQIVFDGLSSKVKGMIHMAESPHCILLDKELDLAYKDVIEFVQENS
jgi:carboxylesterase